MEGLVRAAETSDLSELKKGLQRGRSGGGAMRMPNAADIAALAMEFDNDEGDGEEDAKDGDDLAA